MSKRQYINPHYFNDDGNLYGNCLIGNHVRALAVLVCQKNTIGTYKQRPWSLEGSWSGDRIILASDDMYPNLLGVQTATVEHPERNLYNLIEEEFENISRVTLILLAGMDQTFAVRLLAEVSADDLHYLRILGDALAQYTSSSLRDAVAQRFGPDWLSKYQHHKHLEDQGHFD